MTKYLDLTGLSAVKHVEEEMQTALAPFLESQKRIQGFFDAHEASFQMAAAALTGVAEKAAQLGKLTLPGQQIIDSFNEMQKLTEMARISFEIPQLPAIEPLRFGHLCVEVMEDEEEMIPALIPDRKLTEEDKEDIALKVVEILEERGLAIAANKKEQPKLLPSPNIREILFVRLEGRPKVRVIVNGNYESAFLNGLGKYWGFLVRIAEQEDVVPDDMRGFLDYFNTNDRCSLYTRSGLGLTRVLQIENGRVVPTVRMEVISEKAYQTRLNKVDT